MNYSEMYNKLRYWYNYEVQEYATPLIISYTFAQLLSQNSFRLDEKSEQSVKYKERERTENILITYNSTPFLL